MPQSCRGNGGSWDTGHPTQALPQGRCAVAAPGAIAYLLRLAKLIGLQKYLLDDILRVGPEAENATRKPQHARPVIVYKLIPVRHGPRFLQVAECVVPILLGEFDRRFVTPSVRIFLLFSPKEGTPNHCLKPVHGQDVFQRRVGRDLVGGPEDDTAVVHEEFFRLGDGLSNG